MKRLLSVCAVVLTSLVGTASGQMDLPGYVAGSTPSGKIVAVKISDWSNKETLLQDQKWSHITVNEKGDIAFVDQNKLWLQKYGPGNYPQVVTYDENEPGFREKAHPKYIKKELGVADATHNLVLSPTGRHISAGKGDCALGLKIEGGHADRHWIVDVGNGPALHDFISNPPLFGTTRNCSLTPEDAIGRFDVKRSVSSTTWFAPRSEGFRSPGENLLTSIGGSPSNYAQPQEQKGGEIFAAVVVRENDGFVAIELHDEGLFQYKPRNGNYEPVTYDQRPGTYEIPIGFVRVVSLAWRGDGSLSYLTDDEKVCLIGGSEIQQGIAGSRIAKHPNPMCHSPTPVNWVFKIQPTLVAEGIRAQKIHWVDNETFIFRSENGYLAAWKNNKIEESGKTIPEKWFWCNFKARGTETLASTN